jgi:hypothetical protein
MKKMYQNLWDIVKAVLREKFMILSALIKKISDISNNLTMYLNLLEKQDKAK